ncbi:MAG: TetR/AcrR family transcriptional regulator [Acidimicrobiales bacterium]
MGRIAGVTAAETKQRLLATAASVFARLGYEKASIAQITSEAGLSSGAIYAHYASKAELFVATLRAHGDGEIERLLGGEGVDFASFLTARGAALDRDRSAPRTLLIEAIVAAKHDPEVAKVLTASIVDREARLAAFLRAAQDADEIDADLPPDASVRFVLTIALGSMVVRALDLPSVDHAEWTALIERLVQNIRTTTHETITHEAVRAT